MKPEDWDKLKKLRNVLVEIGNGEHSIPEEDDDLEGEELGSPCCDMDEGCESCQ